MKTILLPIALLCISHISWSAAPTVAISYSGELVAEPCVIPPGEENIELDFGTVIDKYLYINQRTLGKAFTLRLAECDLSLGETVSIAFNGAESSALPGLLAIDSGTVSGIAIGLEYTDGVALPLNKATSKFRLQPGSNMISLKAYVRGEPEAIAARSIGKGEFHASATFLLDYE